jgi:hypothetical protein
MAEVRAAHTQSPQSSDVEYDGPYRIFLHPDTEGYFDHYDEMPQRDQAEVGNDSNDTHGYRGVFAPEDHEDYDDEEPYEDDFVEEDERYEYIRVNGRRIDDDWEYNGERQYADADEDYPSSEDDGEPYYDDESELLDSFPQLRIEAVVQAPRFEGFPAPPRNQQEQRNEWGRQAAIRFHRELLAMNLEIRYDMAAHTTTTEVAQPTYVATEAKEGEETCIICMENVPDSVFDCGNKGFCGVCADRLLRTTPKCPLCRKTVTAFRVEKPEEMEDLDDVPVSWDDFCT